MGSYKLVPQIRHSGHLYGTETIFTAKFRGLVRIFDAHIMFQLQ